MTKSFLLILPMLLFFVCSGCTIIGYDGPYEGRIIDFDTKKPIEGAVVFGEWNRVSPSIAGAIGTYYDYKETLTDKNGNFKLNGVGLLFFSNIDKPSIGLFKAGYEQPHSNFWSGFKNKKYHPEVDVEGNNLVFKLRKLTFEQRRKRIVEILGPGTLEKNRLIWLESDRENIEICSSSQTLFNADKNLIKVDENVKQFCEEFRQKEGNESSYPYPFPIPGTPARKTPNTPLEPSR